MPGYQNLKTKGDLMRLLTMILVRVLLLVGFAYALNSAVAKADFQGEVLPVPTVTLPPIPPRTVLIGDFLADAGPLLIDADNLLVWVRQSQDPIHIFINSRGGKVKAAFLFVDALKEAHRVGVPVICTVNGNAHSAAFHILSNCRTRKLHVGSTLMFHRVKYMFSGSPTFTAEGLKQLEQEASAVDAALFSTAKAALKKPHKWVMDNIIAEHVFTASELLIASPQFGELLQ